MSSFDRKVLTVTKAISNRVAVLERREPGSLSASLKIAVAGMSPLGQTPEELAAFLAALDFGNDVAIWIVERRDLDLAPIVVEDLDADSERRWLDADSTYPHAVFLKRGDDRLTFRFEDLAADRRFYQTPLSARLSNIIESNCFLWVKSHEHAA